MNDISFTILFSTKLLDFKLFYKAEIIIMVSRWRNAALLWRFGVTS